MKMAVNRQNGKEAITHYHVLEPLKKFTYIECRLETGAPTRSGFIWLRSIIRFWVIRSTDRRSRAYPTGGQTLHAKVLGFVHPRTGAYMEFEAPLPEYFKKLLVNLHI